MSTYRKMWYSSSILESLSRILIKLNRASTISLGDVILLVQVGSITLNVRFSIVKDLSPYNTIMEWVWLHKMKVIPSTYHQMVSYLIEAGQVDLLGSQLVAQQCYQVIVKVGQLDPTGDEPESSSVKCK